MTKYIIIHHIPYTSLYACVGVYKDYSKALGQAVLVLDESLPEETFPNRAIEFPFWMEGGENIAIKARPNATEEADAEYCYIIPFSE